MSNQEDVRDGQRIAKVMARAGLCSRRDAEQWIAAGRVSVNGEVLTSPAFNVSDADQVQIDGEPLRAPERTRLFLFHKPRGLVTTAKDPEGRPTIFDALPPDLPRVVAIGRLDINTEGLLLLTNDGGLARVLELPATGWLRRYRVRAHGEVTQEQLDRLRDGVSIDGVDYRGIEAKFERQQGSNVWLTMGLREGKNREIKRVLEHMGLSVNRLIRVSFGPFELGDLAEREVAETRTRVLRDQLGPKLARQAGANFDAPDELAAIVAAPSREERPIRGPRAEPEPRDGPPPKRKHVSVLRAEARDGAAGPRKRVARATTTDRRGRAVQVERVSLANPPPPPPPRERRAPPRRSAGERFGAPDRASRGRDDARPVRRPTGEGFVKRDRPPRAEGGERPRRDDARPGRRPPGEGFVKRDRPPRAEGGEQPRRDDARPGRRPPGEGFVKRDRPPRAEGGGRPRPEDSRPDRRPSGEGRTFGPRSGDGGRPPRGKGPPHGGKPRAPRGR
jgi:23S rRNA pseudouridine2605 synthase